VEALQEALKVQLSEPKLFNGHSLTGPIISSLMPELAQAMNDGVDLLPKSLYEQSEERTAGLCKQECIEQFRAFIEEVKVSLPLPVRELTDKVNAEQKRLQSVSRPFVSCVLLYW